MTEQTDRIRTLADFLAEALPIVVFQDDGDPAELRRAIAARWPGLTRQELAKARKLAEQDTQAPARR